MKHGFGVSTDGIMVLPEAEKDINERGTENWTRKKVFIQTVTFIFERTVKDEAMLAVMIHEMVGNIPGLTGQTFFLRGEAFDISLLQKLVYFVIIDGSPLWVVCLTAAQHGGGKSSTGAALSRGSGVAYLLIPSTVTRVVFASS